MGNGPFKCGSNTDLTIFRSGMKAALAQGETVIADKIYRDARCITPDCLSEQERRLAATIRARHETINSRFKKFAVLRNRFRHHRSRHSYCFHSIANVTQLMMDTDPLFLIE